MLDCPKCSVMADPTQKAASEADLVDLPDLVDMADLADLVARFAARLRAEGLPVGPERSARFASAVELARPATTRELYWCGLATLVGDQAEIPTFDRVFATVFEGSAPPDRNGTPSTVEDMFRPAPPGPGTPGGTRRPPPTMAGAQASPDPSAASTEDTDEDSSMESPFPGLAAAAERLGGRDFGTLSPDELHQLMVAMRRLRLATPLRRSRRYEAGSRGRRIDLRTTMRLAQRSGGFPVRLARHRLRLRPRPLVVLCDISGSMEPYARALLQLLYCAMAAGGPRTEVFTFATRLTRLTKVLARVRPEVALERAGKAAPDWSGGTRIGEALKRFLDRYGSRGLARGAVVLIISDGWETGDARLLGQQMARLSRLAHKIVWANPRTASPRYEPLVAGMAAAWPYCDEVVSAHSLWALDPLLTALGP
jgi:uncharacterized protein with von Willebrand factor type A (vWA) domain